TRPAVFAQRRKASIADPILPKPACVTRSRQSTRPCRHRSTCAGVSQPSPTSTSIALTNCCSASTASADRVTRCWRSCCPIVVRPVVPISHRQLGGSHLDEQGCAAALLPDRQPHTHPDPAQRVASALGAFHSTSRNLPRCIAAIDFPGIVAKVVLD